MSVVPTRSPEWMALEIEHLNADLRRAREALATGRWERTRLIEAAAVLRNAAYRAIPRPFPSSATATDAMCDAWIADHGSEPGFVRMRCGPVDELHRVLAALPALIADRGVELARARDGVIVAAKVSDGVSDPGAPDAKT